MDFMGPKAEQNFYFGVLLATVFGWASVSFQCKQAGVELGFSGCAVQILNQILNLVRPVLIIYKLEALLNDAVWIDKSI